MLCEADDKRTGRHAVALGVLDALKAVSQDAFEASRRRYISGLADPGHDSPIKHALTEAIALADLDDRDATRDRMAAFGEQVRAMVARYPAHLNPFPESFSIRTRWGAECWVNHDGGRMTGFGVRGAFDQDDMDAMAASLFLGAEDGLKATLAARLVKRFAQGFDGPSAHAIGDTGYAVTIAPVTHLGRMVTVEYWDDPMADRPTHWSTFNALS